MTIHRASLLSFDAATWTAIARLSGSLGAVTLPVGEWLNSDLLAADDQVAVLLFDDTNPNDGLILGPWGGLGLVGSPAPVSRLKTALGTHLGNTSVPASTTLYISFFSDHLHTLLGARWSVPIAGTIKNLYVRNTTPQPASGGLVLTLLLNDMAQSLTITIAAQATVGVRSDLINSFSVAAGDYISIRAANNATAASAAIAGISVELDPT